MKNLIKKQIMNPNPFRGLISDLKFINRNTDNLLDKRWVAAYLREIGKLSKRLYAIYPEENFKETIINIYLFILKYEKDNNIKYD